MKRLITCLGLFLISIGISGQEHFPKNNSVKEKNENFTAFTNATIYITPTQKVENGTLLIQKGKVVEVGTSVKVPDNTIIIDLDGKSVYPSFIDIYSSFGIEKPEKAKGTGPQWDSKRNGYYWNDHILPGNKAIDQFKYADKKAKEFRDLGFGVVNTHIMDGIARGTGMLVTLNDDVNNSERIIADRSGQFFSFSKSVTSRQSYPTSLMGSMALIRQLNYDTEWYSKGLSNSKDLSLEAMIDNQDLVPFFEAGNKGNDFRVDMLGNLFNIDYIIVGGGDEYEAIEKIKNTGAKFIIPLDFPSAFDVSDPFAANYLTLEQMRNWNQAPTNPKVLSENEITFALTTYKLKEVSEFKSNIIKAISYGLDETSALESLTTIPAKLLGKSDQIGSLRKGRFANFLITSGDIFDKETVLYENWVQGIKYTIHDMDQVDLSGNYRLSAGGKDFLLKITGKIKPKAEVKLDTVSLNTKMTYSNNWVTLNFTNKETNESYQATGIIKSGSPSFNGKLVLPNGLVSTFVAIKESDDISENKSADTSEEAIPEVLPITFPNVGYGNRTLPKQQNTLFKNATVWTGEDDGILEKTDVLVINGKITKIGKDLNSAGAVVIDATGKHLTAGIIDEHTHIGMSGGGNESGHNSSAEVTVEDIVDPEDIGIYRNLAGGVTAMQILHGSANPIGGRSALVKLKWGEDADGLLIENRPKFIKFALGENVKQSNWQSFNRFPQTRMGVEQLYINYFNRAKEYDIKKKSGDSYRYDEEMEVLAEILRGERFITCHSYVQSEINMLMKVAEQFNFRVNTFTHILEGYKVADKMRVHGVGASTFSDWWAYKYEVKDAIPYNAAIMAKQGIVVAINSDDDEMSRRLNQEAAKAVKYGGLSEEEAWKMVTINPAKLLHLDDRTGSIMVGKDADLVLWSDHPLSMYAKAEKTMIEGAIYFDIEKDAMKRNEIKKERNKLIKMMLNEKEKGNKTQYPKRKDRQVFKCETLN
jgi:imidazolonepropionase-like amidohydrolase